MQARGEPLVILDLHNRHAARPDVANSTVSYGRKGLIMLVLLDGNTSEMRLPPFRKLPWKLLREVSTTRTQPRGNSHSVFDYFEPLLFEQK